MLTIREQARRIMHRMVLPVPQRERTLTLIVPKGTVPAAGHRCLCSVVATRYWRTAHEQQCTRIVVDTGTGHRHQFDTVDLFKHLVRRQLGVVPAVKRVGGRVPRFMASAGAMAVGDRFDTHRPVFAVPITPVSGEQAGSGKDI